MEGAYQELWYLLYSKIIMCSLCPIEATGLCSFYKTFAHRFLWTNWIDLSILSSNQAILNMKGFPRFLELIVGSNSPVKWRPANMKTLLQVILLINRIFSFNPSSDERNQYYSLHPFTCFSPFPPWIEYLHLHGFKLSFFIIIFLEISLLSLDCCSSLK